MRHEVPNFDSAERGALEQGTGVAEITESCHRRVHRPQATSQSASRPCVRLHDVTSTQCPPNRGWAAYSSNRTSSMAVPAARAVVSFQITYNTLFIAQVTGINRDRGRPNMFVIGDAVQQTCGLAHRVNLSLGSVLRPFCAVHSGCTYSVPLQQQRPNNSESGFVWPEQSG